MTAAFVQKLTGSNKTGTNITTLSTGAGSGFHAGNYIVGSLNWYNGTAINQSDITSITDGTNNYTVVDWLGTDTGNAIFFGPAHAGATTITVNFSTGEGYVDIIAHEVSGLNGVTDGHSQTVSFNISSTSVPTPSITTTLNGDYIYAFVTDDNENLGATTVASPFTIENNVLNVAHDAYNVQSSAGSVSTTFTVTNTGANVNYVSGIIALAARKVTWPGDEEQHAPRFRRRRPPQPDDFVAVPPPILTLSETFSPFTLSATIQVPAGPAPVFSGDEEQHLPRHKGSRPPQNDDPFVLVTAAPVTAVYIFDEERGAPRFGRRRPTQNDDQTPFQQAAWVWQGDEEQHQPRFRRWRVPQNDDPFVPLPLVAAASAAIYVFDEEHGPRFRRWHAPQNDELIVPALAAPVTTVYVFDEERGQPRRRIWRPNPNEDTLVIPTYKWVWQGDEEQHKPRSKLWHPPQNDDFVPITSPILTLNVTFSLFTLNATIQLPPGAVPVFSGDEEQHRPKPRLWRGHGDEGFFLPPLPPAGPSTVILGFDQEYSQPRHRTWRIPQPEDFVPRPPPILNLAVTFSPFILSATIQLPAGPAPVLGWQEEQHVPRSRRWHPPQNDEPFVLFKRGVLTPVLFGWEEEQHRPRFRPWRAQQLEDFIPVTPPILTLSKTFGPFTLSGLITVPPVFGVGKSNIPPVRLTNPANAPIELWIGQSARTINQILSGKLNATTSVTLTPNATSTVIFDSRIGISSHVTLMPISASAAAALASGQIWFALTKGSVTINHPSSSAVDQTFGVLLIG